MRVPRVVTFILILSMLVIAIPVFAQDPMGICSWFADGCERFVLIFADGTGDSFVNCGSGAVYVGSGEVGDCPGMYEPWVN